MESLIVILIVIVFIVLITRARAEEEKIKVQSLLEGKTNKEVYPEFEKEVANYFEKYFLEMINKHKFALLEKRKKYLIKDSYGVINDKGWASYKFIKENSYGFVKKTEIDYFYYNLVRPELDKKFKKSPRGFYGDMGEKENIWSGGSWARYCFARRKLKPKYNGLSRKKAVNDWMKENINKVCDEIQDKTAQLGDTSSMNGVEYEQYCKNILEDAGWEVEDTPATGDQGVDLIASIEDVRVCIQCKCFTKPVGNKAVQEVATGTIHWNGTHSVVVGKSGFTKSAKALANSTNVILTSDSELENLENLVL